MKISWILLLSITLIASFANAKDKKSKKKTINGTLLDKIVAVVDDNIITKSQVDRILSTITPRQNILPSVFNRSDFSREEVIEIIIQKFLIRAHLGEVGYIISDDQVESRIK